MQHAGIYYQIFNSDLNNHTNAYVKYLSEVQADKNGDA